MSPAPYPQGWRKVRLGSLCKKGDRFIAFWHGGSKLLSAWNRVPDWIIGMAVPSEVTVIRKKNK